MNSSEFDDYIKNVLSQVSFVFEHQNIKRELMSHLLDLQEEYVSQDVQSSEIPKRVIEDMGDPVLIGKELNQIHHPLIAWLWWVSRLMVVATAVYCLFITGSRFIQHQIDNQFVSDHGFDTKLFLQSVAIEKDALVQDLDLDIRIELQDGALLLDRMIKTKEGTVFILYQEIHAFDLFKASDRYFDLRRFAHLEVAKQSYRPEEDGLLMQDAWNILVFKEIPLEYKSMTLNYKQVSEMFEKELR